MRILCSTTPMDGVFGPFIPLGRALVESGHDVIVGTGSNLQPAVEENGFEYVEAGLSAWDGVRAVAAEIDLERALERKVEPAPAQPRGVAPRLEGAHERLGPEMLMDVDDTAAGAAHTGGNMRTPRQCGSSSKSKYFVRSTLTEPVPAKGPWIVPLCRRIEW